MQFKDELKKWRGKRTQQQVCAELGVKISVYPSWEQGIRVPHVLTQEGIRARMVKFPEKKAE